MKLFFKTSLLKSFFFSTTLILIIIGCKEQNKVADINTEPSLKNGFKKEFLIGSAVNDNLILEKDSLGAQLVKREYNTITPENSMKWMYMEPEKGTFNFEMADQYVDFSSKNNLVFIGHNLVWHSQLADWVSEIDSKKELSESLKNHIQTITSRYRGKIHGWDVVNEALNEDGTLRNSMFLEKLGPNYLINSFKWAQESDPNVELYYNDYNMTNPEKRAGAIKLVQMLQENGAKIDGIGIQGHWSLEEPSLEEIEESIIDYSKLGIQVMITELDITALPNPWDLQGAEVNQNFEGSEFMNPYPTHLPDSISKKLAKRYHDIFQIFKKHKDKIGRVTFWGVNDGQSWLNNWPIRNRTNYPLLFDKQYKPKAAYYSVLQVANDSLN
ncbi:endo-1,4-beta-xylanase [Maribacter arcticus]|uniref:endo-1,4-beta-xylanase n=1 Tax=Maribacter arcticus TaxID=561365 RepID=UPI00300181CA